MANELSITASMTFAKGPTTARMGRGGVLASVTGTKVADLIQEIGTAAEALMLGDISTPGYVLIENLDATNFVSIRAGSGGTNLIDIPPNTTAGPFKLSSASSPHAIADTAPVKIRYLLVEA
jgi:hypothetical protein